VFLTCQGTHVNLICGLYEISYKPVCRKFLSPPKCHVTFKVTVEFEMIIIEF
jgi:hypothetical protein